MPKALLLSIVETIAWCSLMLMAAGVATLLVTQAELRVEAPRWSPSGDASVVARQSPSAKPAQAAATESVPSSLITWRWAVSH